MDKKLFQQFLNKDEWAVKKVFNRYSRLVKHVAFEILQDNDLSDDVVSETFIKLLKTTNVDSTTFVAFMCEIARNSAINLLKERQKLDSLNENDVTSEDTIDTGLLSKLEKGLDKQEYNVFVLHVILEYPFKDIAQIYGQTDSAIRGIYFRARQKCKTLLEGLR